MNEKELFQKIRSSKIHFSLRTRLTVTTGAVVFFSLGVSFGLQALFEWLIPSTANIPLFFQLSFFSLIVTVIATRYLSKLFFNPIKKLNDGMKKIADGEFNTQIKVKSSSLEIQEMYAGFNMMAKELSSTEVIQSDFVSNVSHEFKTPINAIEGYSTLLQGGENLNEEQCMYVDKILLNTKRLSTLVSNILLLSKIENQSIQTNRSFYGLDEQIRECILALETLWAAKNIDLDVDLDSITYNGNEKMMQHVWTNLISNAIKFSPYGDTIKIRLRNTNNHFIFTVEDNGPGLSEEAQKHLFDKFYQEDTSHKEEGNGLGLALVKRILAIEGGIITVKNCKNGGCLFTVTLSSKEK